MPEYLVIEDDARTEKAGTAWWFIFAAHRLLVVEEGASATVPLVADPAALGLRPIRQRYLGTSGGRSCYGAEVSENDPAPPHMGFYGLRYLYGRLAEPQFAVALKAVHLLEWEGATRYCGRCGGEMAPAKEMNARACTGCGLVVFPRISPAVIVLVERNGQVLLARATRFAAELYSVLAGFVEPGESLEETVHREIREEVGIQVKNIRYFGSQPWPFPDSLMVGFIAEYAGGEIRIDETEIDDAGWFDPDRLPMIPGKMSIARKLIDWFVEKQLHGKVPVKPKAERRYAADE